VEDDAAGGRVRPELRAAQVCAALNGAGAHYLVIGGVACILHGHIRATKDVDILIERTLANARRVLEGLEGVGYGFANEWTAEEVLRKPITIVGDDPRVDLFTVAWSVKYEDAIVRATTVEADGITIPLIGLEDLMETKRTGRLQDAADIEVLEEIQRLRGERQ
jgi:predicted nucleotidyltransferase